MNRWVETSGQGPCFGQAIWFTRFREEKDESARVRYVKEVYRVFSVLDRALEGGVGGWWEMVRPPFDPAVLALLSLSRPSTSFFIPRG